MIYATKKHYPDQETIPYETQKAFLEQFTRKDAVYIAGFIDFISSYYSLIDKGAGGITVLLDQNKDMGLPDIDRDTEAAISKDLLDTGTVLEECLDRLTEKYAAGKIRNQSADYSDEEVMKAGYRAALAAFRSVTLDTMKTSDESEKSRILKQVYGAVYEIMAKAIEIYTASEE